MSRPQWMLAICGSVAGVNAVRQALFATAAISPWLATLSGSVALASAAAFILLRRRHWSAAPALLAFGAALPLATILGTERLLADALPVTGRLPGYLAAAAVGLLTAWGGLRELADKRPLQSGTGAPNLLSEAPSIDETSIWVRQRSRTEAPNDAV